MTWPWVWTGAGNERAFWTVEDGQRIRFVHLPDITANPPSLDGVRNFCTVQGVHPRLLRHITMEPSGTCGIAVGSEATWLWTMNGNPSSGAGGGGTWLTVALTLPSGFGPDTQIWHVALAPNGEAWAVGDNGLIAKTADGMTSQVTLTAMPMPSGLPIGSLTGIEFVPGSSNRAVACGDFTSTGKVGSETGGLYFTDDGGASWNQAAFQFEDPVTLLAIEPPEEGRIWKVTFIPNTEIGIAVGGHENAFGYLFVTFDGGETWTQEFHACQSSSGPCASTVNCQRPDPGCGGPTYAQLPMGFDSPLTLYGVGAFADGSAIAVGYGSQILLRAPSVVGKSIWTDVTDRCSAPSMPLWGVGTDGDGFAVITGQPEQLRTTLDNGQTWAQIGLGSAWRTFGLALASSGGSAPTSEVIWTAGRESRIACSEDGGLSWNEQRTWVRGPRSMQHLKAIAVADDGNSDISDDAGVAVGSRWRTASPANLDQWTILATCSGGVGTNGCGWVEVTTVNPNASVADLEQVVWSGMPLSGTTHHFWALGAGTVVRVEVDTAGAPGGCAAAIANTLAPAPVSGVAWSWNDAAFLDPDVGWLVGGDSTGKGVFSYSTTATQSTWSGAVTQLNCGPLVSVSTDGNACYAVDSNGVVLEWNGTTFGGSVAALPSGTWTIRAVAGVSPASAALVAGGDGGQLREWQAVGNTWAIRASRTSYDFVRMAFRDTSLGYALARAIGEDVTIGSSSTALVRFVP